MLEASDAGQGLALMRRGGIDVVLVDLDLADRAGPELIRQVRAESSVPIVAIGDAAAGDARRRALELGADDHVSKPVAVEAIAARVRIQLRRADGVAGISALIGSGRVTLDLEARRCRLDGAEVILTTREFDLLAALIEEPARVRTRRQLLDLGWGSEDVRLRAVDAQVAALRRKLGPAISITTVRGVGYRLDQLS